MIHNDKVNFATYWEHREYFVQHKKLILIFTVLDSWLLKKDNHPEFWLLPIVLRIVLTDGLTLSHILLGHSEMGYLWSENEDDSINTWVAQ